MNTTSVVMLLVLVVLALAAVALVVSLQRRRRRAHLQERFGPEYDRAVEEHGSRRQAERRLADVEYQRDQLDIRELDPAERRRYAEDWTMVQAAFVDNPGAAVRDADRLVGAVMRDRGYPVDDFDTKADMVAADHPDIAAHYRAAHAVGGRSEESDTEELRQAFVHYRALFDELLADGTGRHRADRQIDLTERERAPHAHPQR